MAVGFISILMLLLSGGGELLDYIPTDAYWKSKNIEMNVQTVSAELDGIGADDASKATAVRRLMAIRTLGELKDKAAIPTIQKHVDSKEMFVADYAKRAIAVLEGKPLPALTAADLKEVRESDLWMLPAHCGGVAQIVLRGAPRPDIKKAMATIPFPRQNTEEGKEEALTKMIQQMIDLAEQIGNVRLDVVTVGLSQEVGDREGFFVMFARGQYDREAVKGMIALPGSEAKMIGDVEFTVSGDHVAMGMPSSELFVMISAAGAGDMPLDDLAAAIKEGKGKLRENEDLTKLIEAVDRSANLWAVAKMSDSYRQAPVITAFDSLQLVGKQDGAKLTFEAKGVGQDAETVKSAVEQLTMLVDQAKQNLPGAAEPGDAVAPAEGEAKPAEGAEAPAQTDAAKAASQPLLDFLNSIKASADGSTATMSATVKGSSISMLLLPLMMGM